MREGDPPVGLSLSRVGRGTLVESVRRHLLDAIRDLPGGTRLPSERALTGQLAVGRATVGAALDDLVRQGVIETRGRRGTFIAGGAGEPSPVASTRGAPGAAEPVRARRNAADTIRR